VQAGRNSSVPQTRQTGAVDDGSFCSAPPRSEGSEGPEGTTTIGAEKRADYLLAAPDEVTFRLPTHAPDLRAQDGVCWSLVKRDIANA
jgi:hypothetical protein